MNKNWLFSVAPMMGYTDRHCRYLYRLISSDVRLYTEMVTLSSLQYKGLVNTACDISSVNHACQIGSSNIDDIKKWVPKLVSLGFDEINLNVGCPSNKVQKQNIGLV